MRWAARQDGENEMAVIGLKEETSRSAAGEWSELFFFNSTLSSAPNDHTGLVVDSLPAELP